MTTAHWKGYEFTVHDPAATRWRAVGGLYIFAGPHPDPQSNYQWRAFYAGQTQNFCKRLPTHDNWPAALAAAR